MMKWERYTKKLPFKGRLQKMIIISCLIYAIMLSLGSKIEVPPSEEDKRTIVKRFNAIVSSAHRTLRDIVIRVASLFSAIIIGASLYLHEYSGNVSPTPHPTKNCFHPFSL